MSDAGWQGVLAAKNMGVLKSVSGATFDAHETYEAKSKNRTYTREDSEEAFGKEVWGMLEVLITFLWEPEQMNEKLIVTGTRFFRRGLRQNHLAGFGEAIHDALKTALACPCAECGKVRTAGEAARVVAGADRGVAAQDEWKSHITDAWGWLWNTVSYALTATISSSEDDHPRLVAESWSQIQENHTVEEIGEVLFSELTREAPHVVHLFKRPKKLQSYMFTQVGTRRRLHMRMEAEGAVLNHLSLPGRRWCLVGACPERVCSAGDVGDCGVCGTTARILRRPALLHHPTHQVRRQVRVREALRQGRHAGQLRPLPPRMPAEARGGVLHGSSAAGSARHASASV